MKRSIALTTILALSAGFATAEGVTLSGDARMGIIGADGADTAFTSRTRVKFSMSGETDGGLAFGASFRADNAGDAASGTAGEVHISGAFGKLSMGDVDGAATAAVGHVDGVGLTGLDDLNESLFVANGGGNGEHVDFVFFEGSSDKVTGDPSLLYEYSTEKLAVYASITQPSYVYFDGSENWAAEASAIGGAYTIGNYKISVGLERFAEQLVGAALDGRTDNAIVGLDATFGSVAIKARIGQGGSSFSSGGTGRTDFQYNDQWALSASYAANALTATAFVSELQYTLAETGANQLTREAIGLGASYDLGGGAVATGGIVRQTSTRLSDPAVSGNTFDLGLSFSF